MNLSTPRTLDLIHANATTTTEKTAMHSKGKHPFNVLLSPDENTALRQCAERLGVSRGLALRWALIRLHRMIVLGIPTCASGSSCYVPHMHPTPHIPPPQTPGQTQFPTTLTDKPQLPTPESPTP